MLEVQVRDDIVNIMFSKDLMREDELMNFIERIRVKHLISQSKLTAEDAERLDEELKSDWWGKNRDRFLNRIK
ncbi:MAG: hypothetical protein GY940_00960 [bacterium]|nr:hypothetical protein [bacterium]